MKTFALAGNPNSGKTTLFNALTGATAHVGNWPGVTVDKREGVYKKGSEPVDIIDLPGIYSLSPYTPEEVISRNYILDENPYGVINIVDATNLERNLYLTTQLLEMDVPVIVALNMMDEVAKAGDKVYAVYDGTVTEVVTDSLIGENYVTIKHTSGAISTYKYINAADNLSVGKTVKRGDAIGTIAEAAGMEMSQGEHLHFAMTVNGKPADPDVYLDIVGK